MISCYDKIPDKSNLRKGVLTSAPSFRVRSVVAGAPHQQEQGSWPYFIPSQEAKRQGLQLILILILLCLQPGPHDGGAAHIQGESTRNAPQMWPEVCLLSLMLSPVKLRVKINSGCDFLQGYKKSHTDV